jgi:hypothetical protein
MVFLDWIIYFSEYSLIFKGMNSLNKNFPTKITEEPKRTIIHHPSFLKGNIPERKISRKEHILKDHTCQKNEKRLRNTCS